MSSASTADGSEINPWRSIWRTPLKAYRAVLRTNPRRGAIPISIVCGILYVALVLIGEPQRQLSLSAVAVIAVGVGTVLGVIWLYINGWLTQAVSWFFGGNGNRLETRAAIAWSSLLLVPVFSLLAVWAWRFTDAESVADDDVTLIAISVLVVLTLLYSFVSYIRFLAEAHDFSTIFAIIAAVVSFALVFAVGALIRVLVVQPFSIPSGSMQPNLLIGETVFATKWDYGYSRASAPLGLLGFIKGRIPAGRPERGDIVVFEHPKEPGVIYVKRVVGLPGDRVAVRGGVLSINGTKVELRPVEAFSADKAGTASVPQLTETLPGGVSYRILDSQSGSPGDEYAESLVPEGYMFALGDNRDNAVDSRFNQLGMIPIDNILGRMSLVVSSVDPEIEASDEAPFANIRFERLLSWLR